MSTDAPLVEILARPKQGLKPRPAAGGERKTLAEELRLQLADDIVRGVIGPGMPLDESELAARFHVSRTPVREAIRQLVASGLVQARPHRGAVVASPTPDQLVAMFEAMAELEAVCARLAAERMTAGEREHIAILQEQMRALVMSGNPDRYSVINDAFHGAIYAGAHNSHLADMTIATRARVQPFRRAQFRNIGRLQKSHAEHDLVVQAIAQGNREAAAAAMRTHIMTVRAEYGIYTETV